MKKKSSPIADTKKKRNLKSVNSYRDSLKFSSYEDERAQWKHDRRFIFPEKTFPQTVDEDMRADPSPRFYLFLFFFVSRVCFFSFARVCRLTCISVFTYAASTRRLDRAPCVAIISRPPSVCLHSLSHLPTPKGSRLLLSKTNIYIANARCAIVKSRGNSCFFLLRCRDRLSSRCSPSPDFTRGILTKDRNRGGRNRTIEICRAS